MKIKTSFLYIATAITILLAGCELDNVKPPESTISGNIVYNGESIGIRSVGTGSGSFQLELWQHGYQLFSKIPVYIDQYGHFSAKVFDGEYKLTRQSGTFPWTDNSRDSIDVSVRGGAVVDVPLSPYFMLKNVSFAKSGSAVTATFTVVQTTAGKSLESVKIYLNQTIIVDEINQLAIVTKAASGITLGTPATITVSIPAALTGKAYLFARLGVKTTGVSELIYAIPQKITF